MAYALILVGAALTEFDDHSIAPGDAAWLLLGGAVVFMLAHSFADVLGAMTASGRPLLVDVGAILRRRSVLVLATVPFVLLCVIAAMDRVPTSAAYEIGAGIALLALTLAAALSARQADAGWLRTVVVGAVAFALAAGLMALERLA